MTSPSVQPSELLAQLTEAYTKIPRDERIAAAEQVASAQQSGARWVATPGPQEQAFNSEADVLLYGGQAGGGKSGLLVGYALTGAERTLLMRRQYSDCADLISDSLEKHGSRQGFNGSPPARLMIDERRQIDYGGCKVPGDEEHWRGRPHDFIGIDEASQFIETQVRFLIGWNRPASGSKVRCRVILASNPPERPGEGEWLKVWFAPWLDPTHKLYPTAPGELLWVVSDVYGKDQWVDGPDPIKVGSKMVQPRSRTFIPARLSDNPFLDEIYEANLDALPEPLRSAIRDGNWMISHEDDPWQVLPTNWVLQAQDRWTREPPRNAPMCAIGVDIAQGGADQTVLQMRYDYWLADPIAIPGRDTPLGSDIAALVIKHRRNKAAVILDMGGGYGGSAYEHLKTNLEQMGGDQVVFGFNGAEAIHTRTADRQLAFANKRAEAWWRFREALDPDQEGGSPVMLPWDPGLRSELLSVHWKLTPRGIMIENKQDVIKRLGHSPDKADAAIMAWAVGPSYVTHHAIWKNMTAGGGGRPRVQTGYANRKKRRR